MMKSLLQVVTFLSLLTKAASDQTDSPWHYGETDDAFVPFPAEVQIRLEKEARLYRSKSYPLPVLRVFETLPESSKREKHMWPQIKGITRRLHPNFWPRVQYNISEGFEYGCRKPDPDGDTGATLPITSSHCHRHCLHQGRYCIEETTLHSDHRRAALKEIVRRLCMDTIYHAKDPRYIAYLQQFDDMECLVNPEGGFRNCSVTAMESVGIKYELISSCVSEDKHDKDVPNDAMDRNLRQLSKHRKYNNTLPFVTIDGEKIPDKRLNTNGIFGEYCSSFPSAAEQPLACHACKRCKPVAECLWTLRCNNETDFDPKQIKPEILNLDVDAIIAQLEGADGALVGSGAGNDQLVNNGAKAELVHTNNQEGEGAGGDLFLILLGVLIVVALVTSFLYFYRSYQQERSQKLLSEIAAGKYSSDGTFGIYRDDPNSPLGGRTGDEKDEREHEGSDSELRTRAMALLSIVDDGISVRRLKESIKEKRDSCSKSVDSLEGSNHKGFSDDIDELEKAATTSADDKKAELEKELVVEDLLDDESEWAGSNKRETGSAMAAAIFC